MKAVAGTYGRQPVPYVGYVAVGAPPFWYDPRPARFRRWLPEPSGSTPAGLRAETAIGDGFFGPLLAAGKGGAPRRPLDDISGKKSEAAASIGQFCTDLSARAEPRVASAARIPAELLLPETPPKTSDNSAQLRSRSTQRSCCAPCRFCPARRHRQNGGAFLLRICFITAGTG